LKNFFSFSSFFNDFKSVKAAKIKDFKQIMFAPSNDKFQSRELKPKADYERHETISRLASNFSATKPMSFRAEIKETTRTRQNEAIGNPHGRINQFLLKFMNPNMRHRRPVRYLFT
jgi:hypothetical protein